MIKILEAVTQGFYNDKVELLKYLSGSKHLI